MGQRSGTQTVVAVFAALLKRRLWQQAELARAVGVGTETIHRLLVELRQSGVPLDVAELLRHLRRLPRSKARERLLGIVSEHLRGPVNPPAAPSVVSRDASEHEEQYVAMVEDAAAKCVP